MKTKYVKPEIISVSLLESEGLLAESEVSIGNDEYKSGDAVLSRRDDSFWEDEEE